MSLTFLHIMTFSLKHVVYGCQVAVPSVLLSIVGFYAEVFSIINSAQVDIFIPKDFSYYLWWFTEMVKGINFLKNFCFPEGLPLFIVPWVVWFFFFSITYLFILLLTEVYTSLKCSATSGFNKPIGCAVLTHVRIVWESVNYLCSAHLTFIHFFSSERAKVKVLTFTALLNRHINSCR